MSAESQSRTLNPNLLCSRYRMHFVSLMQPATAAAMSTQHRLYVCELAAACQHYLQAALHVPRMIPLHSDAHRLPAIPRTLELCGAAGVVAAHQDRALAAAESPLPLGTRARRLLQSPSPRSHCGSGTGQLVDRRIASAEVGMLSAPCAVYRPSASPSIRSDLPQWLVMHLGGGQAPGAAADSAGRRMMVHGRAAAHPGAASRRRVPAAVRQSVGRRFGARHTAAAAGSVAAAVGVAAPAVVGVA